MTDDLLIMVLEREIARQRFNAHMHAMSMARKLAVSLDFSRFDSPSVQRNAKHNGYSWIGAL